MLTIEQVGKLRPIFKDLRPLIDKTIAAEKACDVKPLLPVGVLSALIGLSLDSPQSMSTHVVSSGFLSSCISLATSLRQHIQTNPELVPNASDILSQWIGVLQEAGYVVDAPNPPADLRRTQRNIPVPTLWQK
jgi:hypothetical protein